MGPEQPGEPLRPHLLTSLGGWSNHELKVSGEAQAEHRSDEQWINGFKKKNTWNPPTIGQFLILQLPHVFCIFKPSSGSVDIYIYVETKYCIFGLLVLRKIPPVPKLNTRQLPTW